MATQQEVIKAFMAALDTTTLSGAAALDEAIKASSNFKSFKELKAAIIRDYKNSRNSEDFFKTYCGIDYSNGDAGLITGFETGGSATEINDADSVPESGKLNTKFKGNSFTVNGLKVTLADNRTFADLTASEKFIWQALYTWWAKGALDLIAESYGDNFSFGDSSSATVKELAIKFNYDEGTTSTVYWWNTGSGQTTGLQIDINMNGLSGIENNLDKANTELDRTLTHEFTHAVMFANIISQPVMNSLPGFVKEGLAELSIGIKNSRKNLILELDDSKFKSGLDVSKTGTG